METARKTIYPGVEKDEHPNWFIPEETRNAKLASFALERKLRQDKIKHSRRRKALGYITMGLAITMMLIVAGLLLITSITGVMYLTGNLGVATW